MKKRVLIDCFHLVNALTGTRTYTTELCQGLESLDSEFEYLFYPNWRWANKSNFLRGRVSILLKILNHILYFGWKLFVLPLVIVLRRVDVVVTPDYLMPPLKFGAKGITVFHDTFYWDLKRNYNPIWRVVFLKLVQLGIRKNASVVTTSYYIKSKVKGVIKESVPIDVVYQCAKSYKRDFSFSSKNNNETPYFLHIGVFDERKNLVLLVDAFGQFLKDTGRDFNLILVGSRGVGLFHDSLDQVKKKVDELGLSDRVIIPGFLTDSELTVLYQNAFAYVFPSLEEGFGIPILEASNFGLPIIISNQEALMEVANGSALIFEKSSADSLKSKMKEMLNENTRQKCIDMGQRNIERFSQTKFAQDFEHSIERALE